MVQAARPRSGPSRERSIARALTLGLLGALGLPCAACGGNGPPATPAADAGIGGGDAGPDAAATTDLTLPSGAVLAEPALPAAPAPPSLPCTHGWRPIPALLEGGQPACDPWPDTGYASCAAGEAHRPGEPACSAVGVACSATSAYASGLPAGASTLFVRADATAGGDGSVAAPFARIADAIARARSGPGAGTVIAVGKGTYAEAVVVPAGVVLWGACAAQTRIAAPPGATGDGIVALEAGATVRNVTISGGLAGVAVSASGAVIEGVVVDGATGAGIAVHAGGTVDARDSVVRALLQHPTDPAQEGGILVDGGGTAHLERVVVDAAFGRAVRVVGMGSALTLRDGALRDTRFAATGNRGQGAVVSDHATLELDHVAIEENHDIAVEGQSGARVQLADCVLRDTTVAGAGRDGGVGILVDGLGTDVTAERTLLERSTLSSVHVQSDATVELTDVVIRDTRSIPATGMHPGALGTALETSGGTLTGVRVSVERSRNAAVTVSTPSGRLSLTDATILESQHSPGDLESGEALFVLTGGQATFTRVSIRGTEQHGVWLSGVDTHATLTDVTVRDSAPRASDGARGYGVQIVDGASATVERVLIERSVEIGLLVSVNSAVTGTDLTVRGTRAATAAMHAFTGLGTGIFLDFGALPTLTRVHVEDNDGFGIFAGGGGTVAHFTDLRITGTRSWHGPPAVLAGLGHGLEIQRAAYVELDRALIDLNRATGVAISGGDCVLNDTVVRDTLPDERDHLGGAGMYVAGTGTLHGSLVRIERSRHVALAAYGEGSSAVLDGLEVLDTMQNVCAVDTCADSAAGIGVGAYDHGTLRATHFRVARTALCGVQVARGGELDLADGEVSHALIGANVQVDGYDINRLNQRVLYLDDERPLDTSSLPVPNPGGGLEITEPPT